MPTSSPTDSRTEKGSLYTLDDIDNILENETGRDVNKKKRIENGAAGKETVHESNHRLMNGDVKEVQEKMTTDEMTSRQKEEKTEEESTVDVEEEDEDSGLPIDKGWAWVVLAGTFLNTMLFVGYIKSMGILFVEYLRLFEASATTTSLVMGVSSAGYSISAVFTMHCILEKLGVRKTSLLGGFISTVAMATGVFAPNITFLVCVHATLTGVGHSMMMGPGLVLLGHYFNKRRGFAVAVSMSSISVSAGVFPMLTRFLLDNYDIRGTMLIFTGITMNMFVGASLFRPLDSFRRPRKAKPIPKIIVTENGHAKLPLLEEKEAWTGSTHLTETSSHTSREYLARLNENSTSRRRTVSTCSKSSRSLNGGLASSQKMLYASNPDILAASVVDIADMSDTSSNHSNGKRRTSCQILDLSLFKKPMFRLFSVCALLGIVSNIVPNYLPAVVSERGISKTDAAILLLILGAIDFISRLSLGYFVDLKILRVSKIVAIGLILGGTSAMLSMLYNTFPLMVMFSVIHGLVGSAYQSLFPILVVDFLGKEYLGKTLGFTSMYHGLSLAFTHPIIGAIKDISGTFNNTYTYLGACAYAAALCLLIGEPLCRKKDDKYKQSLGEDIIVTEKIKV